MRGRPGLEAAARSKPQGLTPPQRRCARPVHPAATTSASRPSPGAPQPQCAASSANGTRKKTVPAPPSRQRTVEGGGSVQKGQPAGRAERGGTATSSRRQPPARPRLPHTAPKGRAVDLAARRRRVGRRSVPVGRVAPPLPILAEVLGCSSAATKAAASLCTEATERAKGVRAVESVRNVAQDSQASSLVGLGHGGPKE